MGDFIVQYEPVHPCIHQRQTRTAMKPMSAIPARMNMATPSARERYIPPSPAALLLNSTASTMTSASLMFLAVCSIKTVFTIMPSLSVFPVAAGNDLCLRGNGVHHVNPRLDRAAVFQRRRDQHPVVEAGIPFQMVHRGQVGKGDLH